MTLERHDRLAVEEDRVRVVERVETLGAEFAAVERMPS